MHDRLVKALKILDFSEHQLVNDKGEITGNISFEAHVKAFFNLLALADYFNDTLIDKAVDYLAADKLFAVSEQQVKADLKNACLMAKKSGQFNVDVFIEEFAKQEYFTIADIVDLITFLQQTAFDRLSGFERDRLQSRDWMANSAADFIKYATQLGIITPLPPRAHDYCINAVMGASAPRVISRIKYRTTLEAVPGLQLGESWALSGKRELSKGLDDEETMAAVAKSVGKPVNYVEKQQGEDRRVFLDGVYETMMVNYLLEQLCKGKNFYFLDSPVEKNHWRATAQQNAVDIAPIIIEKIRSKEIKPSSDNIYRFMVIAEQPYVGRMARPVQRAFNDEIQKKKLDIKFIVEPCGVGIKPEDCLNPEKIKGINSELGSLIAERYKDACLRLKAEYRLRSQEIIMYSSRDKKYAALCEEKQAAQAPAATALFAPTTNTSNVASASALNSSSSVQSSSFKP